MILFQRMSDTVAVVVCDVLLQCVSHTSARLLTGVVITSCLCPSVCLSVCICVCVIVYSYSDWTGRLVAALRSDDAVICVDTMLRLCIDMLRYVMSHGQPVSQSTRPDIFSLTPPPPATACLVLSSTIFVSTKVGRIMSR